MTLCRLPHDMDGVLCIQAGLHLGVEHIPMPTMGPLLKFGYHHQKPAGMKASHPHSSVGTVLHIPTELRPQALHSARSTSVLPKDSNSEVLQDTRAATEPKRVHWWGTLTPCMGICTVGADSDSSLRAHHRGVQHRVRHISGLLEGVPPGISHICGYTTLPAALNGSYTDKNPKG